MLERMLYGEVRVQYLYGGADITVQSLDSGPRTEIRKRSLCILLTKHQAIEMHEK
jgi:hypothetical protein